MLEVVFFFNFILIFMTCTVVYVLVYPFYIVPVCIFFYIKQAHYLHSAHNCNAAGHLCFNYPSLLFSDGTAHNQRNAMCQNGTNENSKRKKTDSCIVTTTHKTLNTQRKKKGEIKGGRRGRRKCRFFLKRQKEM